MDAASGGRRDGRGEKRRECSIGRVKRLLALLAGGFGIGALLRRRRRAAALPEPADELRARLAETRTAPERKAPEPPPVAEPEPPAAVEGDEPPGDVAARRSDVHERARRAIDELGG